MEPRLLVEVLHSPDPVAFGVFEHDEGADGLNHHGLHGDAPTVLGDGLGALAVVSMDGKVGDVVGHRFRCEEGGTKVWTIRHVRGGWLAVS